MKCYNVGCGPLGTTNHSKRNIDQSKPHSEAFVEPNGPQPQLRLKVIAIITNIIFLIQIMHEIFGQKPWVEPLATAGSSVTETKIIQRTITQHDKVFHYKNLITSCILINILVFKHNIQDSVMELQDSVTRPVISYGIASL